MKSKTDKTIDPAMFTIPSNYSDPTLKERDVMIAGIQEKIKVIVE